VACTPRSLPLVARLLAALCALAATSGTLVACGKDAHRVAVKPGTHGAPPARLSPAPAAPGHAPAAPSRAPAAPAVPMSPAKRRYLAHFKGDCRAVSAIGQASSDRLNVLVARVHAGDVRAVAELTVFFKRLSGAFGQGLAGTRRLGPPPEPGSHYGRTYLADSSRIVLALGQLGDAVSHLNAPALKQASAHLARATASAHVAARRYGFPDCSAAVPSSPFGSGAGSPAV